MEKNTCKQPINEIAISEKMEQAAYDAGNLVEMIEYCSLTIENVTGVPACVCGLFRAIYSVAYKTWDEITDSRDDFESCYQENNQIHKQKASEASARYSI